MGILRLQLAGGKEDVSFIQELLIHRVKYEV
jgi:hypothetical protein